MHRFAIAALLALAAGSAQAYQLVVNSNNPALPEAAVRQMAQSIGTEIGTLIPESPQIKVVVTTRGKVRQTENRYVYLHRVELTKQFNGGAPYPFSGWLPIKKNEYYGVADDKEMQQQLESLLRDFFNELKTVDPNTASPR